MLSGTWFVAAFFCCVGICSCVAGAARDPQRWIDEAVDEPPRLAPGYVLVPIAEGSESQRGGRELSMFPQWSLIGNGAARDHVELEGVQAQFEDGWLRIDRDRMWTYRTILPRVFSMHPLQVALGQIADEPVVLALTKSRATTGLYFVAIIRYVDGLEIYRSVLSASQVWDVAAAADGLRIVGAGTTLALRPAR